MYLSYYQLEKKPFQISTESEFLWLGEKHREVLAHISNGLMGQSGFLLLTGDVGTGKTTLINGCVKGLAVNTFVVHVHQPGLSQEDFLDYIAAKLQFSPKFNGREEFISHFTDFWSRVSRERKRVVFIIDEAQYLTHDVLEVLWMLSQVEGAEKAGVNILLAGQNECIEIIDAYNDGILAQNIKRRCILEPIVEEETLSYIEHRLQVAGSPEEIFSQEAMKAIHIISKGVPRLINIICDQVLLYGYTLECNEITEELVWQCSQGSNFPPAVDIPTPEDVERSLQNWLSHSTIPPLQIAIGMRKGIASDHKVERGRMKITALLFVGVIFSSLFALQNLGITMSPAGLWPFQEESVQIIDNASKISSSVPEKKPVLQLRSTSEKMGTETPEEKKQPHDSITSSSASLLIEKSNMITKEFDSNNLQSIAPSETSQFDEIAFSMLVEEKTQESMAPVPLSSSEVGNQPSEDYIESISLSGDDPPQLSVDSKAEVSSNQSPLTDQKDDNKQSTTAVTEIKDNTVEVVSSPSQDKEKAHEVPAGINDRPVSKDMVSQKDSGAQVLQKTEKSGAGTQSTPQLSEDESLNKKMDENLLQASASPDDPGAVIDWLLASQKKR